MIYKIFKGFVDFMGSKVISGRLIFRVGGRNKEKQIVSELLDNAQINLIYPLKFSYGQSN
jgi:ribosomal protein L16/L10AE